MSKPLTIWLIGDGKPGHENQSLGLAEALGRRLPCDIHRISLAGKRGLFQRIKAAALSAVAMPKPDLIIAAGHATHPSLLWLARKHHAHSVVIMRPSLPMGWFSLCISPSHDFKPGFTRPNLITTRGAMNLMTPSESAHKTGRIILIGGPSSSHGWNQDQLLEKIRYITRKGEWELANSRRTPDGFIEKAIRDFPTIRVIPHEKTTPDWLPSKLASSGEVWVTEDSVSMIYEALSSGAKVGLLPAPRLSETSRVLRGLEELIREGFLTTFQAWEDSGTLALPPETLQEADRCAAEMIRRFNL